MNRRNLKPGDFVMGLTETRSISFRHGVIVAISNLHRDSHHGCHTHITVLWAGGGISEQCDCDLVVPSDLGI